jgi:catechol 2,3-dioxygenase
MGSPPAPITGADGADLASPLEARDRTRHVGRQERNTAMSAAIEAPRSATAPTSAPSGMRIGHVHLKVADLDRALAFWRDIIGLEVQQRMGSQAVFLSVDGYHHHIALNTWESAGGSPPPFGTTGLYHVALLYPDRPALARALKRLVEAGWPLEGASDHGVSEALYLRDPDGNGVELYRDRPREEWPHDKDGGLAMVTRRLDLRALLAEAA